MPSFYLFCFLKISNIPMFSMGTGHFSYFNWGNLRHEIIGEKKKHELTRDNLTVQTSLSQVTLGNDNLGSKFFIRIK